MLTKKYCVLLKVSTPLKRDGGKKTKKKPKNTRIVYIVIGIVPKMILTPPGDAAVWSAS